MPFTLWRRRKKTPDVKPWEPRTPTPQLTEHRTYVPTSLISYRKTRGRINA